MKITILGTGKIGGTLGRKWVTAGHEVQFSVRNMNKPEAVTLVQSLGERASLADVSSAIRFGEVVVFAIPGSAMDETIAIHGDALNGKMLIDTTNKIGSSPINSLGTLTAHAPQSSIYRAFNMYGWENFENPVFGQLHADLFYCGTDTMARSSVEQLISDVGLHPVYLGGVDQAGLLDDLLKLWFALANGQKMGRQLTFKVLTR